MGIFLMILIDEIEQGNKSVWLMELSVQKLFDAESGPIGDIIKYKTRKAEEKSEVDDGLDDMICTITVIWK